MPRGLSMKLIEYNYIIICIYTYWYFDVQLTIKQVRVLTPQNKDLPHGSREWPQTHTGARNRQELLPTAAAENSPNPHRRKKLAGIDAVAIAVLLPLPVPCGAAPAALDW